MHFVRLGTLCTVLLIPTSGIQTFPQELAPLVPLRVYRDNTPGLVRPVSTLTVSPEYTPEALKVKASGSMILEITVGPNGRVLDAIVTQGLDGQPDMDEQAIAALSEWRFDPGTLNGQPVAVRTFVSFTLRAR